MLFRNAKGWWFSRIVVLLILLQSISLGAQSSAWWHITDEEGLPGLTVYQILQDTQGYMWMATNNGLCRFDGRDFEVYQDLRMQDNDILELKKDRFERLWFFNLPGELSYLYQDSIFQFSKSYLDKDEEVKNFWTLENGLLCLINKNNNTYLLLIGFGLERNFILLDKKELIGPNSSASKGMIINEGKQPYFVHIAKGIHKLSILKIYKDSLSKRIYSFGNQVLSAKQKLPPFLVQSVSSVYHVESDSVVRITPIEGIIKKLIEMEKEYLIPFNKNGVYQYSKTKQNLERIKSISNLDVNCIAKDMENNYWIGTSGKGVYVTPNLDIEYFNSLNGKLPEDYIYSIHGTKDKIYVGHKNGWLTTFENEKLIESNQIINRGDLRSITTNKKEELFLGFDKGIIKFPIGQPLEYDKSRISNFGAIKKLKFHNDFIYEANSSGVHRLKFHKENNSNEVSLNEKIYSKRTYGLCFDEKKWTWIGTTEGIYFNDGNKTQQFLAGNLNNAYSVNDMCFSTDNSIWAALKQQGVLRIKNEKTLRKYTTNDGLLSNICNVVWPEKDTLWIGTNKGINKLVIPTGKIYSLTVNDGLPSNQITAIYTRQNKIWIGTPKGLAIMPRKIFDFIPPKPETRLKTIKINGDLYPNERSYSLDYDQNNVQIQYRGIAFHAKGKEKYQYRMLGLDTTWQYTDSRSVYYYTLEPGKYEFEVNTISSKDIKGLATSKIKIYISEAWWKIWWIQLLAVFMLLGLTSWLIYNRQRKLLAQERKENQIQENINSLKTKALQTQMNPHFIFNTLNAIQDHLLTNNKEQALESLSHFARMINFIFENAGNKKITLKEELGFLKHYLDLEKLRFEDQIDIILNVDASMQAKENEIELPPLLIQPIIENAFKHGLHHKLEKGRLEINFVHAIDMACKCSIEDDGVGRAKAAEFSLNQFANQNRTTSGLEITKERLSLFHKDKYLSTDKYFRITDLIDRNNNGIGTKVEIWF